jgi:hypothetical protein
MYLSASKDHKAGADRKNDTDLHARGPTTGKLSPKRWNGVVDGVSEMNDRFGGWSKQI